MLLSELVGPVHGPDPDIVGVTSDSRKIGPGWLFAALPGSIVDGRDFIPMALAGGAVAILTGPGDDIPGAVVVHSQDPRRAFALAAAKLAGPMPRHCLAVTGTNGKTSVATFTRQILAAEQLGCASIGTLGLVVSRPGQPGEALTPPGLTTPDAADLANQFAGLARSGIDYVALEASSHGLDQRRLDGVSLSAAGFTNLTQDHLDYHGDMETYLAAKLRLFDQLLPQDGTAVINVDGARSEDVVSVCKTRQLKLITVGTRGDTLRLLDRKPDGRGQNLTLSLDGKTVTVHLPLVGGFQAENALVAAGLAMAAGLDAETAVQALANLSGAAGRLQHIGSVSGAEAYIDYAHTPDGLKSLLEALRPHTPGRLVVVFGAGGDRDRSKRPQMGAIAERLADVAIITDDNPRSEDPASIRAAISAAAPSARIIGDRRQAIETGVMDLQTGDVLVVAGKGHELGQTIGNQVHPFDDAQEVRRALSLRETAQ
jgi:UDP-N-acetylmuramoyl-L-alanyl-D-glutamate--2,6-diaminopimelate ligase